MASADNPFEVFFDLVPTGAALYAPLYDEGGELVDFRFVRLNPAGQRLLGLPAEPPRTFREYYPNSEPTGIFAQYRRAYLTGEASTYDVPYAGDGLNTCFRLVAQRSGELLVVNFTDISDLPFATSEQSLQESRAREQAALIEAEAERQRLHQVLMRMPANIALLRGPEHVYDLVNLEYERLFPARTTLGRTIREVIPEIAGQGFYELFDRVYQTGEPFYEAEAEAWADYDGTGDLQCRYYRTSFEPIRNAQGEVVEVLNFAVDITAQVEARRQVEQLNQQLEARVQARTEELAALNEELQASNEELNESNRQLTRTNIDLDTFVYTASHDLKAPITNIEGIALALRDTLPATVQQNELVAHLLELLNQTVSRFQVTITQLTDISRLQLAHAGPAEWVELARVVENVRLDLLTLLTTAGTQLTVEVPRELVMSFPPANLRSIIYNLLSNAVKYRAADRPSQVRVHAEQEAQAIVLTVQDNGLGMSELQQRQLFGLFQRLHTHVEGTGVGLYISKRLIKNAGGTIEVHSQPDVGTTFTVSFPT
ncbi:sensor histidine kinase [Hymenobacter glacieicola]|uniref:histidine kinase n=1 Tax=Hymenobacter glacieicola TaxID=1562124 RepID=A0ABQ1WNL0_9BACT|nr:PAS domain-containing sensor histidine kinase [Hymenobacter glacieicola]GGG38941.1 hypothetical protein GCM10011378_14040 [Hymenobacter glacieicola]